MAEHISDEDLAEFRASFEADGVALCCPSDDDIAGILARLDAAEAERDRLRAEVERYRSEPLIKSIERILDEHSAWIARPSPDVTKAVALAAGIAGAEANRRAASDYERHLEAEVERLRAVLRPFAWLGDRIAIGPQTVTAVPDTEVDDDEEGEILTVWDASGYQTIRRRHLVRAAEALRDAPPSEPTDREAAAAIERLRTPDMFWIEDGALVEDWTDALDGAPPLEVLELDTARSLGSRYAVYIPQDDTKSYRWRDDCRLFASREEAEAAVAKAKGAQDG